jgi:RHS repeat-associated protein
VDANNPTGLPQVVEERDDLNALRGYYTYGDDLLAMTRTGATSFYHTDGLGSTRLLTNEAAAATDIYGYDGSGNLAAAAGITPNPYLFAGEQFEPALGLYNLRARSYDPATSRFLGRDPLGGRQNDPRTLHPYLYAHADPVNITDPTGLFSMVELFTTLGIQNVLKGLDVARTTAQHCALTGKLEIAQEVLFWGQLAAAAPILAESLFGNRAFNVGFEATVAAKRYINVFSAPDKIKEAKGTIGVKANGAVTVGFALTREDDLKVGGTIFLNDLSKSSFNIGAGPVGFTFTPAGPAASGLSFRHSIKIFDVTKCTVPLVKGALNLGASMSLKEAKVSASVVLEMLQGLVKVDFPLIPE